MRIRGLNQTYRHFARYRQIAEVFIRHGFGYMIEQLDLLDLIPIRRRVVKVDEEVRKLSLGQRLRSVLEDLGPTFIKLGQLLSTRHDLVPPDLLAELEHLQDRLPPAPFTEIKAVIEEELGAPLSDFFAEFEEEPLAVASIGQVHRARLLSGDQIVVKVRRPKIERVIDVDLEILVGFARLAEDRLKPDLFRPTELVEEFSRSMRRELDYTIEGYNAERFRRNFKDWPEIHIPRVYWELTTNRILALEYIEGIKVSDTEGLDRAGIDRRAVGRLGARAFMHQVMINGFFHGDPHPGNVFVKEGNHIAYLDFGLVGRLDEKTMADVATLFIGVIRRDASKVVKGLTSVGAVDEATNMRILRADITDIVERHYGKQLDEIQLSTVMADALELIHRHRIRVPMDFVILGKALITMEGVGKSLDPQFNAVEIALPFASQLIQRRLSPLRLAKEWGGDGLDYLEMLKDVPPSFHQVLRKALAGRLVLQLQHAGLDRLMKKLDVASNRLSFSLVTASLIIGSSLVMQAERGPTLFGYPFVGVLGYGIAAFCGIGLMLAIIRSGRI